MAPPFSSKGDPSNPAIVFLHGFLGSGSEWEAVTEQLSSNYFCILPDLPGHGSNRGLSNFATLNYDTISEQLLALLDKQAITKAHLVGYSMGGRVGLYFALRHPDRIKQLILESASPGIEGEEERGKRREWDRAWAELLREKGIEEFVDQWYAMDLFASIRKNPKRYEEMKAIRKQNDAAALATIIEALSPGTQEPLWGKLSELDLPVLMIVGEKDEKYREITRRMKGLLPGATRMVVPGAGHNVHFEEPGAFAEILWPHLRND